MVAHKFKTGDLSYFRPLSLTAETRLASIRLCGRCLLTPTANCNIK